MKQPETPRKVCFYSVASHLGGGERSLLELAIALKNRPELGYSPWVLLPRAEGLLVDRLRSAGIEHEVIPIPGGFYGMSRASLARALRSGMASLPAMGLYLARVRSRIVEKRPALIHSNGIKCHLLSAAIGPLCGTPVLWHLRDILPPGAVLTTLRALRRGCGAYVVANSRATGEAFSGGSHGFAVAHNGLDPSQYSLRPSKLFHRKWDIAPEVPLVGIMGILARWKGQMEFLRMASGLIASGTEAHFVIIGDEIYDTKSDQGFATELRQECERLSIGNRVHFAGFHENPAEALNGLDILVHASTRPEPFGRVILEAMACGVPVVASRAGGVPEFVRDGLTGILCEPGDIEGMRNAVAALLADSGLREKLVERARVDFLSSYTIEKHSETVAALYDSIASE